MDEAGLDLQLICQGAGVYADQLPPEQALEIVRMSNNVLAERLAGPQRSVAGRHRAVAQKYRRLGGGNRTHGGARLSRRAALSARRRQNVGRHAGNGPDLREDSELDLPIFMHGAGTAQDPSLARLEDGGAGVAYAVLSDGEVAECCLRMIASGLFDRYPNLKIVIRSSGGGLPLLLHRFFWKHKGPQRRAALLGNFPRTFSDRLRQFRCPHVVVSGRQDGREQYGLRLRLLRRARSAKQIFYALSAQPNPEHVKGFMERNSRQLLHI